MNKNMKSKRILYQNKRKTPFITHHQKIVPISMIFLRSRYIMIIIKLNRQINQLFDMILENKFI